MVVRSAAKSLYGELEEGEVSTKWAANGAFRLCWFGISYHKGSDPDEILSYVRSKLKCSVFVAHDMSGF